MTSLTRGADPPDLGVPHALDRTVLVDHDGGVSGGRAESPSAIPDGVLDLRWGRVHVHPFKVRARRHHPGDPSIRQMEYLLDQLLFRGRKFARTRRLLDQCSNFLFRCVYLRRPWNPQQPQQCVRRASRRTAGDVMRAITANGPATRLEICSGLRRAMAFGTSSPITKEKYVNRVTTRPSAITSLYGARMEIVAR